MSVRVLVRQDVSRTICYLSRSKEMCGDIGSNTFTWTDKIKPARSTGLRVYCIEE